MGNLRNALFATGATATLVAGLFLLLPGATAAIQPQAPLVQLIDYNSGTADTLRLNLTVPVIIPPGELVPLSYARVLYTTGAVQFNTTDGAASKGHLLNAQSCSATVTNVTGVGTRYGAFNGYGYTEFAAHGYGYGYVFGNEVTSNQLAGYDAGGGNPTGYGYGYGPAEGATSPITVTVTVRADQCLHPSNFTVASGKFGTFNLQVLVGADSSIAFASLPTTLTLRNPEVAFTTGTLTDGLNAFQLSTQASGTQTTFGFFANLGTLDGNKSFIGQSQELTLPAGTFGLKAQIVLNAIKPLPEGAYIQVTFEDQLTAGRAFSLANAPFGINPTTISSHTSAKPAAGYIAVRATGIDPTVGLSDYIDLKLTLNVPQSYFTDNGLSSANFRLLRFSDGGDLLSPAPTCSFMAAPGSDFQYLCTLTHFSSFAMISSPFVGGGGGSGATTTTSTSASNVATSSSSTTTTGTTSGTTTAGTQTSGGSTQTVQQTGTPTTTKTKTPGFEVAFLAAALGAAVVFVRRRLK